MYLAEEISEKWKPVMEHKDLAPIADPIKRDITLRLLENQATALQEAAFTNNINVSGAGSIDTYDPVLISLVRRALPSLMAFDVMGVQPMSGPTGLIFAITSAYSTQGGTEALNAEADTDFSGAGTHVATDVTNNPFAGTWTTGTGTTTAAVEATDFDAAEMAFRIDKTSVEAKSRALQAKYTTELQQDLKAVHGLDAESELSNILAQEIISEINREMVRTMYNAANVGAQFASTPGTFDMDVDSSGRWSVEKFKGLLFAIERDANAIMKNTRRGRGNVIVCSADVASALDMAGKLDTGGGAAAGLNVDTTSSTFAGVLNGKYKVYIDPYGSANPDFYVVGYKGQNAYDAGMFYCPYVPLEKVSTMDARTFQPKIGFKTRYGLVANPFTSISTDSNNYYRKTLVTNIL